MSEFLRTGELTQTHAFVHSVVKGIQVRPRNAASVYSIPTPDDMSIREANFAEVALSTAEFAIQCLMVGRDAAFLQIRELGGDVMELTGSSDLENRVGDLRPSRGLNVDVVPFAPSDYRLAYGRLVRDLAFQRLRFGGAHDGVLVLPT